MTTKQVLVSLRGGMNMFKEHLSNDKTKYFIIDTHGGKDIESVYDDKDFVTSVALKF